MKFQPVPPSDAPSGAPALFPRGEYDAVVDVAEETTSKKPPHAEMFKLGIKVYNGAATTYVWEYLMPAGGAAWKLRAFCEAAGILADYENGELYADSMMGRNLRVKLDVEPARDGYDAKNRVKVFMPANGNGGGAARPSDDDDSTPF